MSSISEITEAFPFRADIPGQATAGTADEWPILRASFAGVIKRIMFTPKAAVTFDATNYMTLRVRNRSTNGAGNVQVAALVVNVVGSNMTAWVAKDLATPPLAIRVASGDVLTLEKVNTGTGMVLPAGVFEIMIQPS